MALILIQLNSTCALYSSGLNMSTDCLNVRLVIYDSQIALILLVILDGKVFIVKNIWNFPKLGFSYRGLITIDAPHPNGSLVHRNRKTRSRR